MKRVSRDIDPGEAKELLERVPRACLSFVNKNGPQVQPVRLEYTNDRFLVCVPRAGRDQLIPGQEAVLLVDDGIYYYDLRAIYIRGQLQLVLPPQGTTDPITWFELKPQKMVAWDYGSLHEVTDEPG